VIFDFYGTLAPGRSVEAQEQARADVSAALGVDPAAFDAELTATIDERFRGAGGDVAGSLAWLADRIDAVVTPDALVAAAAVRLTVERQFGEPRPDAVAVLAELRRRGLRIGVVSDCSAELPAYFGALPIAPFVDAPVFSFVTGARKPDPANYLTCCAALRVEPSACLYVGDGGSNELAGARAVGMRPVHLDVAAEQGGPVYGRHATWDGERVTSLTEVLALL
jgi:putative hydrolase of the HAD superfamily